MKSKNVNNVKVGLFVIAGLAFVIFTLYMIGKNRNLLGGSFPLRAVVSNVNGLVPGNNVRYKGIDVGTVQSIAVENDTAIVVTMLIDNKMRPYIKRNAIASIGSDGLMGNKLININSQTGHAEPVKSGEIIYSLKSIETDEMLRTLNTTNNNIEKITGNLYEITVKLNRSESLWSLLSDTLLAGDLKSAIAQFKAAGSNTAGLTATANSLVHELEQGKGLAKTLFTDTTMSRQLTASIEEMRRASKETALIISELHGVVAALEHGEGAAALILSDTVLRNKLFTSVENIEEGTARFSENMEALKHNFLFRKYFKKMQKEQKENASANASAP